ncbi:hypothetical protein ABW19_dt0206754 [Dactylella cylindrospora]|nr:hypothetical protein ABW19_dt0206754 [Dactylella cylindrospora]
MKAREGNVKHQRQRIGYDSCSFVLGIKNDWYPNEKTIRLPQYEETCTMQKRQAGIAGTIYLLRYDLGLTFALETTACCRIDKHGHGQHTTTTKLIAHGS